MAAAMPALSSVYGLRSNPVALVAPDTSTKNSRPRGDLHILAFDSIRPQDRLDLEGRFRPCWLPAAISRDKFFSVARSLTSSFTGVPSMADTVPKSMTTRPSSPCARRRQLPLLHLRPRPRRNHDHIAHLDIVHHPVADPLTDFVA